MPEYKVRYKNSKFFGQKVELDGKSFTRCEFENCMIVLERGETEVSGCRFRNCQLMLRGNAYVIGKIIKIFTGKGPLKVLDLEEPPFEETPSLLEAPEESAKGRAEEGEKGDQAESIDSL